MRLKEILGRMDEAADNLGDDPEALHAALDDILLDAVPESISARYKEIQESADWWAAA